MKTTVRNKVLSNHLKSLRALSGLSQPQVAKEFQKRTGLPMERQIISSYEMGLKIPSAQRLDTLLIIYGQLNKDKRLKMIARLLLGE